MTEIGLKWLSLQEEKRANQAREAENFRHNYASEQDAMAQTGIKRDTLSETSRSNLAKEQETKRSNVASERLKSQENAVKHAGNLMKYETDSRNAAAKERANEIKNFEVQGKNATKLGDQIINLVDAVIPG